MESKTRIADNAKIQDIDQAAAFARQVRQLTGMEPGYEKNKEKRKPIMKQKTGRFQATLWAKEVIISPKKPEQIGFIPERSFIIDKVCIQRSIYSFKANDYIRQQIWFSPEELRDLCEVLDIFSQQMSNCPIAFKQEAQAETEEAGKETGKEAGQVQVMAVSQ
jgi:hypothetical protein